MQGPGHLLQHSISPLSAMAFESRLRGTAALLEEACMAWPEIRGNQFLRLHQRMQ